MTLKTLLTLSALLVAVPAIAQDQARTQTRDPATHVDGATPTQTRTRTRDASHQASQDMSRERSRSMSGGGPGKGGGAGTGGGHDTNLLVIPGEEGLGSPVASLSATGGAAIDLSDSAFLDLGATWRRTDTPDGTCSGPSASASVVWRWE